MKHRTARFLLCGWAVVALLGMQTAVWAGVTINNVSISPRVLLELYSSYQANQKAITMVSPWVFLISLTSDSASSSFQFDVEIRDKDQRVASAAFETTAPVNPGTTIFNGGQIRAAGGPIDFNDKYVSAKDLSEVIGGKAPLRGDFMVTITPRNPAGPPYTFRFALFAPASSQSFPPMLVFPNNVEVSSLLPIFSWTPGQNAETYVVRVSLNQDPQVNTLWTSEPIKGTQIMYPMSGPALEKNQKYYWQVLAFDSFGRPAGGIAGASQPAWFSINNFTNVITAVSPAEVEIALRSAVADKTLFEKLVNYTPVSVESNCPDVADLLRQLRDGSAKVTACELE